jgi:hypothetical protein
MSVCSSKSYRSAEPGTVCGTVAGVFRPHILAGQSPLHPVLEVTVSLPGDLSVTVLTGKFLDCAGAPLNGSLTLTPSTDVTDATGAVVIPMAERVYQISAQGTITTDGLVATDNANLSPQGWVYQVTLQIAGLAPKAWSILLPYSSSPVDISGITPVVPQPDVTSYVPLIGGDMTGTLVLDGAPHPLQIPAGADADYVLTSDADGNASWQPAQGGADATGLTLNDGTGALWQVAVDPTGAFYTQPVLQDEAYGVITDEAGAALV